MRVLVTHLRRDVARGLPRLREKLLRLFHPLLRHEFRERHPHLLAERRAEIIGAHLRRVGDLVQGERLLGEILLDIADRLLHHAPAPALRRLVPKLDRPPQQPPQVSLHVPPAHREIPHLPLAGIPQQLLLGIPQLLHEGNRGKADAQHQVIAKPLVLERLLLVPQELLHEAVDLVRPPPHQELAHDFRVRLADVRAIQAPLVCRPENAADVLDVQDVLAGPEETVGKDAVHFLIYLRQQAQAPHGLARRATPVHLPVVSGADARDILDAFLPQLLHLRLLALDEDAVGVQGPTERQVLRVTLEIPEQFLALRGDQPGIPRLPGRFQIRRLPLPQAHHREVVPGGINFKGQLLCLLINLTHRKLPFENLLKKYPFCELPILQEILANLL